MTIQRHFASSPPTWTLFDVIVDGNGSGDFTTIQDALNAAPQDDSDYVIFLKNGVYSERLHITRPNVHLLGESRQHTIISGGCANGHIRQDGKIPGTYGSRTVNVDSVGFRATSLTIQNRFDYIANEKKSDLDPTKLKHTQAVALLIGKHGDRAQFKDVSLDSYHDTLYVSAGRSYFDHCVITGHVDFIFGGGCALFHHCEVRARQRLDAPDDEPMGFIAAPCTHISQPFGLVFEFCQFTKEANVPAQSYALGRPWHPTTQFNDGFYADPNAIGHCAYLHCEFDDHLAGWEKMGGRSIDGETQWFFPEDARFWEYQNQQKGHLRQPKTPYKLSDENISEYTLTTIFDGWQPDISIVNDTLVNLHIAHPLLNSLADIELIDRCGDTRRIATAPQSQVQVNIQGLTLPILVIVTPHQSSTIGLKTLIVSEPHADSTIDVSLLSQLLVEQTLSAQTQDLSLPPAVPIFSKQHWRHIRQSTFHALREIC